MNEDATEGFLKFRILILLITVLGYFVMPGRLFNSSKINLIFLEELQVFLKRDEDPPLKNIFSTLFPNLLTVRTTGLKSSSPETNIAVS